MSERIQKLLATAGIASRRAIEEMIAAGRVTVNGRPAEIGQKINHDDHVRVDMQLVPLSRKTEQARVLLYRKKVGELVTREDPEGRKTVFRKLPELDSGRWIAVGRLDINTSGLLLLTNDGELARRLMHPSFEMRREYAVRVLGTVDRDVIARLKAGVALEDGFAKFETIEAGANNATLGDEMDGPANSWWTVTVKQGRNRVVRRLLESQKLQVSRLMRVCYGPIVLGRGIKSGSYREATDEELQALLESVQMQAVKPAKKPRKAARHGADEFAAEDKPVSSGRHRPMFRDGDQPRAEAERPRRSKPAGSAKPAGGTGGRPSHVSNRAEGRDRGKPGAKASPDRRGRNAPSKPGTRDGASRFEKPAIKGGDPSQRLVAQPTPREARFPLPSEDQFRDRAPAGERAFKPRSERTPASGKPAAGKNKTQGKPSARRDGDAPRKASGASAKKSGFKPGGFKSGAKPDSKPGSRGPSRSGPPGRRKPKS